MLKTLSLEKMNLLSNCERHYNILSDQFGSEVFFDSVIPFGINFNQNGFFMGQGFLDRPYRGHILHHMDRAVRGSL